MTDREDGPPPDELADRLDDLEDALSELRAELDDGRRSSGIPRPPRPSELLRFTERYTIPTVIALLEATIRSLELLRGALRLADPDRDLGGADRTASSDRLDAVRGEASDRLAGSLRELRRALSAADLPSEPEARSIVDEARELSTEIERRLDDDARGMPADRDRGDAGDAENAGAAGAADGPVRIDVAGPDDGESDSGAAGPPDDGGADDDVDVEAELRTLKRQYGADDPDVDVDPDPDPDADAAPAGGDDGDADPADSTEEPGDDGTAPPDDDPADPDA